MTHCHFRYPRYPLHNYCLTLAIRAMVSMVSRSFRSIWRGWNDCGTLATFAAANSAKESIWLYMGVSISRCTPTAGWLINVDNGKSIYKWMMTRGIPISGNHRMMIIDVDGCRWMSCDELIWIDLWVVQWKSWDHMPRKPPLGNWHSCRLNRRAPETAIESTPKGPQKIYWRAQKKGHTLPEVLC